MPHASPTFRRCSAVLACAAFRFGGFAMLWIAVGPAAAQPPSGGGREGGRRMFDPEEMVARMDENKNGQIDPEEMQGRSRFFLESMARDNGLDLSKPIPTAKLREIMQARSQQRGGDGNRGGNSNGGNNNPSGNIAANSGSGATKPTVIAPMGFGVEQKNTATVPGFGTAATTDSWDAIKAKYGDRIVERVEESLQRNDKNKDGILDAEEIKAGQWRGDPKDSDLNKDGKLSRSELAERQRLRDQNGGGGGPGGGPGGGQGGGGGRPNFGGGPGFNGGPGGFQGGGFSGGGFPGGGFNGGGMAPSNGGPSSASVSTASPATASVATAGTSTPVRTVVVSTPAPSSSSPASSASSGGASSQIGGYADGLLKQYDTNKDGVLQRDEWSQMSSKRQKADTNGDGLITKTEIMAQLTDYSGASSSGSPGSTSSGASPGSATYGARAVSKGNVKTYRFLAPVERLPKGLPDWFTRSDSNGDGQVAMSEFSSAWDEAKAAEFAKWDRNGDGLITPRECTGEK